MNPTIHRLYIGTMVMVIIATIIYLSYTGWSYYTLPLEERFYHPKYDWFKPAGAMGHGLGIVGTLLILFGVSIYIARKRYGFLEKYIRLKYLLEFHIFLCTLGPIMVLFHTSFKFGGIVSIAFWSMVAVVLSGVLGRFIYIQIPRTIEGRQLGLQEVNELQSQLQTNIQESIKLPEILQSEIQGLGQFTPLSISGKMKKRTVLNKLKSYLKTQNIPTIQQKHLTQLVKKEISISQRIKRLERMQKWFQYWHVAHLPFALIMLVIVVIHVIVTLALGYKWIF